MPTLNFYSKRNWHSGLTSAELTDSKPLAIARREQCYMRTAAYLLAVQRVADATQLRGLYP